MARGIHWRLQDTLALLIIPLELFLGWLISKTGVAEMPNMFVNLIPFLLKALSLILIVFLYRSVLSEDWKRFRKRIWLKLLLCLGMAAIMYIVLTTSRKFIGISQSAEAMQAVTGGLPYALYLLIAFTPVLAPVTEEIVFRHVLFYKFKDRLPLALLMCIISSFLFGAIHINNFGGDLLLTIPYMVIACLYNLLYYFGKNIWFSITTHLLFNFAQSVIPAVMIPFLLRNLG